jgi:hypothetical protein
VQADAIFDLFSEVEYDIFEIDKNGTEMQINRFALNNMVGHVGNNYIARPRVMT